MIFAPLKIKFLSNISKSTHDISKLVAFLNSLSKTEWKQTTKCTYYDFYVKFYKKSTILPEIFSSQDLKSQMNLLMDGFSKF